MPPQRTIPTMIKPVKSSERTHEENQERAYIAASRRSDRSLEARVESARRASVIHKRRTGRSLRVTEQDVINEEMYEEEDDDLASQYRRLTAHIQTDDAAFNQRLEACLTGQMGVRYALGQYLSDSYAQLQFQNTQQFPRPSPMYQNPYMAQQRFREQIIQQSNSPNFSYRQAPYPIPIPHQQRSAMHGRSASIANPQMTSNRTQSPALPDDEKRRTSLPASLGTIGSPDLTRTPTSNTSSSPNATPTTSQIGAFKLQPSQPPQSQYNTPYFNSDHPFFTAALPAESRQMLLGSALDPRDLMTSVFMAGGQHIPNSYYHRESRFPPTPNIGGKDISGSKDVSGGQAYPSLDGLNSTLAPGELEKTPASDSKPAGQISFFDAGVKETAGSRTGTPGGDFNLFIDQEAWDEVSASSQP